MTRLVIVEDEPIIAADMEIILQKLGYQVIGTFDNAEEALPFILLNNPDLLILDISLAGKMDGIALAEVIRVKTEIPYIFITSYVDKATISRVQNLQPAAYIVKPFQDKNLAVNIELALSRSDRFKKERTAPTQIETEQVFVRNNNELQALQASDITHIEASDNYAYVFTATNKYLLSHTLKSIEEKLAGMGFVRVHKSYLINIRHISSIQEGYLFMNEIKVPVGKSFKQELMRLIKVL
jgi:DNA-binding LytR/AlgR family response regulator